MDAYCLKCKKKVDAEGEEVKMKNGRPAFKGICPNCKTKVFKFLPSKK